MSSAIHHFRGCSLLGLVTCLGLLAGVVPSGAAAAEFRIEVGAGLAHGDHDLAFSRDIGSVGLSVESDSAINGSGVAAAAAIWIDRLFLENLSLGLEYLHVRNTADLDFSVATLGQTVSVGNGFDLRIDAFMLDVAWRKNRGPTHPYIAVGAGVTRLAADVDSVLAVNAGTSNLVSFSDSAYAPVGQAVIGFDYDITRHVYVGASARYFLFDGRLFGRDEVTREIAAIAKLGIAF